MKVYGMLEKAQLEVSASALLSTDPAGRIGWNSTSKRMEVVNNGVEVQVVASHALTGTRVSPTAIAAVGGVVFSGYCLFNTIFISGSGGAVIISASPQISAGNFAGQRLTLIGGANTVTFETDKGTCVLAQDEILDMLYTGSGWVEAFRSN